MGFIDEEKLNKELEGLKEYLDTRNLVMGEVEFLLSNFIPYMHYQQKKAAMENMKKQAPGKSIVKPTGKDKGT